MTNMKIQVGEVSVKQFLNQWILQLMLVSKCFGSVFPTINLGKEKKIVEHIVNQNLSPWM